MRLAGFAGLRSAVLGAGFGGLGGDSFVDTFVSIGSYNLDHRSLAYNLELVVNILDPACNAAAVAMLEEDMAASTELMLASFTKRSLFVRLLERMAYALRRWL